MEIDAFDSRTLFWNVDGIPVSVGAGVGPSAVVAWDVPEGRAFPIDSLREESQVSRSEFASLVLQVAKNHLPAPALQHRIDPEIWRQCMAENDADDEADNLRMQERMKDPQWWAGFRRLRPELADRPDMQGPTDE